MSVITLAEPTLYIKPGKDLVLYIKKVDYDPKYQKAEIHFVDEKGAIGRTSFTFKTKLKKGQNDIGLTIFTILTRCAHRDWSLKNIDPQSLVGKYVMADGEPDTYTSKTTGKEVTVTNFKNWREAEPESEFDVSFLDDEEDEEDEDYEEDEEESDPEEDDIDDLL